MRIYEFPLVSKASDDLWTDLAASNRFSCSNEKTNHPVKILHHFISFFCQKSIEL